MKRAEIETLMAVEAVGYKALLSDTEAQRIDTLAFSDLVVQEGIWPTKIWLTEKAKDMIKQHYA